MEEAVRKSLEDLFVAFGHDKYALSNCILQSLQKFAQSTNGNRITIKSDKKVRVYVDGCFDIMHSGHYNALRLVCNRKYYIFIDKRRSWVMFS
jgi:hypothetical protein